MNALPRDVLNFKIRDASNIRRRNRIVSDQLDRASAKRLTASPMQPNQTVQARSVGMLPLPLRAIAGESISVGVPAATEGKSFFIETFGCQMNDHDSEKVAGVLQERGYQPVATPAQADLGPL